MVAADFWRNLHREFKDLAHEEYTAVPDPAGNRRLRAYGEYKAEGSSASGCWRLSEGLSENFLSRFEDTATRAGVALEPPQGVEPLAFWLHRIFLHLLDSRRNDRSPLVVGRRDQGGIIRDVCETSSTYCLRLAKQALQTHPVQSARKPVRRHGRYATIDEALQKIAEMRPTSHAEAFRCLQGRAPLPYAEPFKTAQGWLTGFQRDQPRARAWLAKAWSRPELPPFRRGPK